MRGRSSDTVARSEADAIGFGCGLRAPHSLLSKPHFDHPARVCDLESAFDPQGKANAHPLTVSGDCLIYYGIAAVF